MRITLFIPLVMITMASCAQEKEYNIGDIKTELDAINVSNIKSACDCSDGMEKIASILYKTTEKFASRTEIMSDSLALQIVSLTTEKTSEVAKKCSLELRLNDSDILNCESFKSLEEKSKILNNKFKN